MKNDIIEKISCFQCANLTDKAKQSFISFDLCDEDPCKLHKMPKKDKKSFGKWKAYDIDCKFFESESSDTIEQCSSCGFKVDVGCFLHLYPIREWLVRCGDFDKTAWEVAVVKTNIYAKHNAEFNCRMGYDGLMPLSWRMSKGVNCSLCADRGGEQSCPLTNGYLRKTIEIEAVKETPNTVIINAD